MRRADYGKFYNDLESAKSDYMIVVQTCMKYPEGNLRIMGSAYLALGQIYLEMNQRDEAYSNFVEVEKILKESLFKELTKNGQEQINTEIEVE